MQTHLVTWSPIFYFIMEVMKAKEEENEIQLFNN